MAKNHAKQEGKASLIFIWILIILLALGTFFVVKSYNEQSSDFISSEAVEAAFSQTLGKPAGKITESELSSVEGVDFYGMGDSSLAIYYLKGYGEAAADEDASKYIVQATLSQSEFMEDFHLFTGIKTLSIMNYSGEAFVFDMANVPADTYKNLEEFYTSSVTVDNSNLINTHKGLTTLGLAGAGLTSIPDISALENLAVLDLSSNELTNIDALAGLNNEKITNIYLTGNKIEDYSPIAHIDEAKITKDTEEAEEVAEESTDAAESTEATDATEEATGEATTEEATVEEVTTETTEATETSAETTEVTTEITEVAE